MNYRETILRTLLSKYEGERNVLACNLDVYIARPTSIPEHVDFIQYVDQLVGQLAELDDKIGLTKDLLNTIERCLEIE